MSLNGKPSVEEPGALFLGKSSDVKGLLPRPVKRGPTRRTRQARRVNDNLKNRRVVDRSPSFGRRQAAC